MKKRRNKTILRRTSMCRHYYVNTIRPVTCMSVPPKTKRKEITQWSKGKILPKWKGKERKKIAKGEGEDINPRKTMRPANHISVPLAITQHLYRLSFCSRETTVDSIDYKILGIFQYQQYRHKKISIMGGKKGSTEGINSISAIKRLNIA